MVKLNKELLAGTFILLITVNLYNLLNFMFQWSMARMLTVSDYGILATLISLIYLLAIFTESIQIAVAKYTSIQDNEGMVKSILKKSLKKSLIISSLTFIFYLLISIPLSYLLKIDYLLLFANGFLIFPFFLAPVSRGIMQGMKKFGAFGFNLVTEGVVKLALAIFFVFIGFRVYGAVVAIILAVAFSFLISFLSFKKVMNSVEQYPKTQQIYSFFRPAFIINLLILTFSSIDIILAKVVFSEELAGYYALASVIGKIIFLATNPISKAMFPLSSEISKDESKKSSHIFFNALGALSFITLCVLPIFYLFPNQLIRLFAGKVAAQSVEVLFLVSMAFCIISFINLILIYKLSLNKTKGAYYLIMFIIIEIILMTYFSDSLLQFSYAFIASSILFLIGSIIFLE